MTSRLHGVYSEILNWRVLLRWQGWEHAARDQKPGAG